MKKLFTLFLMAIAFGLFLIFIVFLKGVLLIAAFLCVLIIAANLIWSVLPLKARGSFRNNRWKFVGILLSCSLFLFFFGEAVNFYCFPPLSHPISIAGNSVMVAFTLILGWGLAKRGRKRILIVASVAFGILIAFLVVIASRSQSSIFQHDLEQIKSLPYLSWVSADENLEKRGVVRNRYDPAYQAFNLYTDDGFPDAYLIDLSGKILHTWSDGESPWSHVEMLKNGDLLGIVHGHSLARVDWDSKVKWIKKMNVHHDLDVAENNDIYTLVSKDEVVFKSGFPLPIVNDYISVLAPAGEVKKRYSVFSIIKEEIPSDLSRQVRRWWLKKYYPWRNLMITVRKNMSKLIGGRGSSYNYYDVFHTNTVKVIDRDMEGLCKKGDILICVRQLDLVGILDIDQKKLIWGWGPGILDCPHNSTLLEDGNILIFDNGRHRTYSRIVELDPLTKEIVWVYESQPQQQFHSKLRGSCQRLPDGKTLITESEKGHVFEVTPDGEIVWEFYNPRINMELKKRRAIYRMMRILNPEEYPVLREFYTPS